MKSRKISKLLGLAGLSLLYSFSPLEQKAEAQELKPFRGLCYGPFRDGQSPEWGVYPSESQIRDDLTNKIVYLAPKIRTYGNENILYRIPEFCRDAGVECYAGAWVDNTSEDNNQVARLIQIGKLGYATTKALIVGSEFLYRHPGMESQLISWVNQVKSQTGKLVSANEQWHIYRDYPNLVNAIDFGLINIYPFWEGQSIDNAAAFVLDRFNFIKNKYPGKTFMIGETGWPSQGQVVGSAVPSKANQERYTRDIARIARENGIEVFWFEAFCEKWKGEGGVGAYWGAFDSSRTIMPSTFNFFRDNNRFKSINETNLNIQTYSGNNYFLEKSSDLTKTNWQTVTNFTGKIGTNSTSLRVNSTNNPSFYRFGMGI